MFIVISHFIGIASPQADGNISGTAGNITSNFQEANNHNNPINGQNLSNQSYDIKVALDHIFISKKNNSLEISEIVVFRNEGREIYYAKDNHTFFAISTPPDVKNLKTQVMECCLVQENGMVYMDPMQSIPQGSNFDMQISYTLHPEGKEYVFNKSAVYNTTSVLMFIDTKSLSIDGSNETIKLGGNEYKIISFNDLKAGETVSIPVKMTKEPDYLYAGIGMFSLFSIGLVYLFRGKIFRKNKKEYTLEELESEKRKIFKTIYGFEKHAGPERSAELGNLIEDYRLKAIQIFIKIDNLNNKGQSEMLQKGMKQT